MKNKVLGFLVVLICLQVFLSFVSAQDNNDSQEILYGLQKLEFNIENEVLDIVVENSFETLTVLDNDVNYMSYININEGQFDESIAYNFIDIYPDSLVYSYKDADYINDNSISFRIVDYSPYNDNIDFDKINYSENYSLVDNPNIYYEKDNSSSQIEIDAYSNLSNITYKHNFGEDYCVDCYGYLNGAEVEENDFSKDKYYESYEFDNRMYSNFSEDFKVKLYHVKDTFDYENHLVNSEDEFLYYNDGQLYR